MIAVLRTRPISSLSTIAWGRLVQRKALRVRAIERWAGEKVSARFAHAAASISEIAGAIQTERYDLPRFLEVTEP